MLRLFDTLAARLRHAAGVAKISLTNMLSARELTGGYIASVSSDCCCPSA